MNKRKKEEKRLIKGLLTNAEHWERRKQKQLKNWQKNPKNRGKQPL